MATQVEAKILERVEAVVEGHMILKSEVSSFKKRLTGKKLINQNLIDLVGLKKKASSKEVLDFLILKKLLVAQSTKEKGSLNLQDSVKNEIAQLARQNSMTPKELENQIVSQGIDFNSYKKFIGESSLIRNTIERNVISQVRPDEEDFVSYLKSNNIKGIASSYIYNLDQIFIPLTLKDASDLALKMNSNNFKNYFKESEKYGIDATSLGDIRLTELSPQLREVIKSYQAGNVTQALKEQGGFRVFYINSRKTTFNIPNTPQIQKLQRVFYDKLIKERFKAWSKTISSQYFVRINS
jgi:parvulin-like peptidyl-prolyl isomerase